MISRISVIFANHIETRMDGEFVMCPATQAAIDRITHDQFRSRALMLDTMRSDTGIWSTGRFCNALLEGWKDSDLSLATGRDKDWWISTMNALSRTDSSCVPQILEPKDLHLP